jgi:hypothetical protein
MINTNMKRVGKCGLSSLVSVSIVGALLAAPAFAQTDAERISDLERKLERSMQLIDQLSNKVNKLEGDKKDVPGGTTNTAARLESVEQQVSQMTSGMAKHSSNNEGLPIHGFMDAGFATNSSSDLAKNPKGYYIGALSFYLAPNFGDNVKALVEPNFEIAPDGTVATDLERLQIGYTFSDAATVWGGRVHTPYGFWNTGFHHGAQMQTSVLRPRFLDFEDKGGILPAHMVGFMGTGKIKAGEGKVTYDAFVGNGPKIVMGAGQTPGILDINLAGDNNHQAMVGFNVGYEFSGNLDGLRVAGHGLSGDVDDDATAANKTGLSMLGGSAVYLSDDWELLSEYYSFSNKDKNLIGSTGTHKSWAGYMQAGKAFNDLMPYLRLERTVLDQTDNYFSQQDSGQSYARQSLGVRYNLNHRAALKLEVLNSKFEAFGTARIATSFRSLFAQYAIGF